MTNLDLIKSKLECLSKQSPHNQFWNISYKLGEELFNIVKDKKPSNVLEIGTSNGFSSLWILKAISKNSILTTIEVDKKRFNIAKSNFKDCNILNVIQINKEILIYLNSNNFSKQFDFIFLDAAQKFYLEIFKKLEEEKLLSSNFTLVADNILTHKSIQNFTEYVKKNYKTKLIKKDSGFLIVSN